MSYEYYSSCMYVYVVIGSQPFFYRREMLSIYYTANSPCHEKEASKTREGGEQLFYYEHAQQHRHQQYEYTTEKK